MATGERLDQPRLFSTGGSEQFVPLSSGLLEGYAPDGELYMLADLPEFTPEDLQVLAGMDYSDIFNEVTKMLLGRAIPRGVRELSAAKFAGEDFFTFDRDGNLPFTRLQNGLIAVGLSEGPTGSFKDMAMQPLSVWMNFLQRIKGNPMTLMVSTSGDTGPAALAAFSEMTDIDIVAISPSRGVSPLQRAQMAGYANPNKGVHVLEVDTDFSGINQMHVEVDQAFDLGSVNSVNIGRLIAQVPYYVTSYLKAIRQSGGNIGDPVDVSIPSGNFGNALSAIIARKMKLPIRKIIVATNENDTLSTLFNTGVFKLSDFQPTNSSAQDVRLPSNVRRYFSLLFNNDPGKIARVYERLQAVGHVAIWDEIGIDDPSIWQGVMAATVTKEARAKAIKGESEASDGAVILDPHTANGVAAVHILDMLDSGVPMLVMETAKAFKFGRTVMDILDTDIEPLRPYRFQGLEERYGRRSLIRIPPNGRSLGLYLINNTRARRIRRND